MKIIIGLLAFLIANGAWSETQNQKNENNDCIKKDRRFVLQGTETFTLQSEHTRNTFEFVVSLPSSYSVSPKKQYPVIYFLDAYWDMPLLYSIYGSLQYDNVIPESILVGISLPEGADIATIRDKFFSPSALKSIPEETGKAEQFYEMLRTEVAPFIQRQYRAIKSPDARVLAGQSMGGLFTLYAMYNQPQFFKRFIAVNPASIWDSAHLASIDDRFSKKNKILDARVFISHGSEEYAPFRDATIAFKKQLSERKYQGLDLQNYTLEGMRHTGGKAEAYTRGLLWVFKDLAQDKKSGLQNAMEGS